MNRWSAGASIGIHDGMAPTKGLTRIYQFQHFSLNGRYMLTNRVGIMVDANYDFLDFINKPYNTYMVRTTVQGVVNAGDIMHLQQVMPRIGVLVHGGFGFSSMWSDNNPKYANTESLSDRADGMLSFTFGMTPQFKLSEKWSLNADLAFIFNARQTNRFDMQARNTHGAIGGYMLNASVGITRYFGKNKSHADWTPTKYSEGLDELKARVASLEEQLKDDDKDGIPNGIDAEPATAEGAKVDSKGVAIKDSDNDGILDAFDKCPDVAGTFSGNGCLDSDADGVSDNLDNCPETAGTLTNKGCPELDKGTKELMNRALQSVQFDYNEEKKLLPSALPTLNEVVALMKDHDDYRLELAGYTDNIGGSDENMARSIDRAQTVANYLIMNGVAADRITVKGYGEQNPKASNDTPEGQALNRRVEFNIMFK
jgi:OOP family OmpA-OmpF porin